MVENSLLDLKYGHLGLPVYDLERNTWKYARRLGRHHELRQFVNFRQILAGTRQKQKDSNVKDWAVAHAERYDRKLEHGLSLLIRSYPELRPANRLFPALHRASEAVAATLARYDPTRGALFAYGSTPVDLKRSRTTNIPLLALPGGKSGEALRLVRLTPQEYGWEDEQLRLRLPLPSNEVGWWVGQGPPILQICFPESLRRQDPSDFLAVRLPGAVVIFEPRYGHVAGPTGVSLDCVYPPSRVQAMPLLRIAPGTSKTGSYADVSFNPWNHNGIAVVDHEGNWAIHKIGETHGKGRIISGNLINHGTIINPPTTEEEDEDQYEEDGWARILWAGSESRIVICNRLHICTYDIDSETHLNIPFPDTRGEPQGCHLDILRCPGHPQWVFLLTTEQMFWMEVSILDNERLLKPSDRVRVILSTRHFRDPRDVTLTMRIMNDEKDILVLVSSRKNSVVSSLRLMKPDEEGGIPAWASDPTQLVLPALTKDMPEINDYVIRKTYPGILGDEESLYSTNRFYSLEILTKDLAMQQTLLHSTPNSNSAFQITGTRRRALPPTMYPTKRGKPKTFDNLIVRDDLMIRKPRYEKVVRPDFKVTYKKKVEDDPKERAKYGPTIDKEAVFENITRDLPAGDSTSTPQTLIDIAGDLQTLVLEGDEILAYPSMILSEHIQSTPIIPDLSQASDAFAELLKTIAPVKVPAEPGIGVKCLKIPEWIFNWNMPIEDVTLRHIYDRLALQQIVPLHIHMPPRLRVAKEKAVRTAAAEYMLSCAKIQIVDIPEENKEMEEESQPNPFGPELSQSTEEDSSQPSLPGQSFDLPFHPSPSRKGKTRAASAVPESQSQELPKFPINPLLSKSPSLQSISHISFAPGYQTYTMRSVTQRLSQYVVIRKSPRGRDPRPATILKHWALNENPELYEYTLTKEVIEKAKEEANLDPEARKIQWEKRMRFERRKQREEEKWREMVIASSQASQIRIESSDAGGRSRSGSRSVGRGLSEARSLREGSGQSMWEGSSQVGSLKGSSQPRSLRESSSVFDSQGLSQSQSRSQTGGRGKDRRPRKKKKIPGF